MASKEWIKFNEDSKAPSNRDAYCAEHGGEFTDRGRNRGWCWSGGDTTKKIEEKVVVVKNTNKTSVFGKKKK